MTVELADNVSYQDENIEGLTRTIVHSSLRPLPEGKDISLFERVSAGQQLTFPMDP